MATLKTSIALYDGMTGPLKHMTTAMNILLNSFEAMQGASGKAIDTAALQRGREELSRAETAFDGIEKSIQAADQKQQKLNQSIRGAGQEQHQLNQKMRDGGGAADSLLSKFKGIAKAIGGLMGIQKVIGLSDQMAESKARLSLIVDDGGSVEALENKIQNMSLETGSSFLDNMQSVAKMGLMAKKAFTNNDEIIQFVELLNKSFVIGGASAQEQSAAIYQLNQAMASGRLQGDEYRSIVENAPMLAQAIEKYMTDAGVPGTMKDWAKDGLITAQVIKAALFESAKDIDIRFRDLPMTWGRVWNNFVTMALSAFDPILKAIGNIANSEKFQPFFDGIISGLAMVASVLGLVMELAVSVGSAIYDNWAWIEPLVWGLVAALIAYNAVMGIGWITTLKNIAGKAAHAVASAAETAAIIALTIAQDGLNAALALCPITWIILAIIALIAIFYAVIGVINKVTGSTISATGLICGAVMWLLSVIGNIVIGLLNSLIQCIWTLFVEPFLGIIEFILNATGGGFDSFGDGVANLIGQIISWFLSLGKVVTKIIDAIFGTDWTSGLSAMQDEVLAWGKNDTAITLDRSAPGLDFRFDNTDAFDKGNRFGAGIEEKIKGLFEGQDPPPVPDDPPGKGLYEDPLEGIGGGVGDTAANTATMANELEISEEDLAYLRDIAEREAVNRFTTAEIKVDLGGVNNNVSSNVDLDGMVRYLEDTLYETMEVAAEGVYT